MPINWNQFLARYQQDRGGYLFCGSEPQGNSQLVLPQGDSFPLLVSFFLEYDGRTSSRSLQVRTMVQLEHPFELHIHRRSTAGGGIGKLAGLVGAGMDFGFPEATRGRIITTNHRAFTKLVLSDLALRNILLGEEEADLLVQPGPQPGGWHLVQVTPTAFGGTFTTDGPWVSEAMRADPLFPSEQERETLLQAGSAHFNAMLDALLEQLRVLRDAVTRWPVPADPS